LKSGLRRLCKFEKKHRFLLRKLLLLFLFIGTFFLRFFLIDRLTGLLWDEAFVGFFSQDMVLGEQVHTRGYARYLSTPYYQYGVTLSLLVFGSTIFGLKFLPVLLSCFSVILVYLLAKDLFGNKTAIISLILFGFSGTIIMMERMGRLNSFFLLFPLYFLISNLKKGKNLTWPVVASFFLLVHPLLMFSIFLALFIIVYYKKERQIVKESKKIVILSLIFCLPLIINLPYQLQYVLNEQAGQTQQLFQVFEILPYAVNSINSFVEPLFYSGTPIFFSSPKESLFNYNLTLTGGLNATLMGDINRDSSGVFVLPKDSIISYHLSLNDFGITVIGSLFFVSLFFLIYKIIKKKSSKEEEILVFWIIGAFCFIVGLSTLSGKGISTRYFCIMFPAIIMSLSLILKRMFIKKGLFSLLAVFLMLFYLISNLYPLYDYFDWNLNEGVWYNHNLQKETSVYLKTLPKDSIIFGDHDLSIDLTFLTSREPSVERAKPIVYINGTPPRGEFEEHLIEELEKNANRDIFVVVSLIGDLDFFEELGFKINKSFYNNKGLEIYRIYHKKGEDGVISYQEINGINIENRELRLKYFTSGVEKGWIRVYYWNSGWKWLVDLNRAESSFVYGNRTLNFKDSLNSQIFILEDGKYIPAIELENHSIKGNKELKVILEFEETNLTETFKMSSNKSEALIEINSSVADEITLDVFIANERYTKNWYATKIEKETCNVDKFLGKCYHFSNDQRITFVLGTENSTVIKEKKIGFWIRGVILSEKSDTLKLEVKGYKK